MKNLWFVFLIILSPLMVKAQSWSLVWADEFTSATINTANWNFETGGGGWGNNELQNYTSRPENVNINNGMLHIIAKKEQYGGSSYTSARMTSKAKQYLTYGKVEARVKVPMQQGLWPAFWMLGENISQVGWPQCGEIDILEHVNKEADIHGTIHWDNNGHAQYGGKTSFDGTKYHVYAIEWDLNTIKWFLDGTQYWSANIANNINSTNEFHNPFFVILNMAVGGTWPGAPDNTTVFPDTLHVDYVRFYQWSNTVSTPPVITSNSSLTFCQGDSVTLSSSAASSYLWSNAATTQSIVVKVSGSYSVNITDALGATGSSASTIVVVNTLPPVPTISANGTTFTSSSSAGNQWYLDGNSIVTANQQNYIVTKNGDYMVKVTDNNSCSASSAISNYTSVNPIPVITSNTSLTFCQSDSVMLSCNNSDAYLWSNAATTQSIVVKSSGNYTVATTDSFGSTSVSAAAIVVVNALPPVPTISANGTTFTSSSSRGNQWYEGVNLITGATAQNYTATQNGTYSVKVTDSNLCVSTSEALIYFNVGIASVLSAKGIRIYPNPLQGIVHVEATHTMISKIVIYNLYNQIVYQANDKNETIDLSLKPKGIYLIQLYLPDTIISEKLLIQ